MQSWLRLPSGSVIRWVLIGEKSYNFYLRFDTFLSSENRQHRWTGGAQRLHITADDNQNDSIASTAWRVQSRHDHKMSFKLDICVFPSPSICLVNYEFHSDSLISHSSDMIIIIVIISVLREEQRNFFHLHAESHVNYANLIRHQFVLIDHWLEFSIWQKIRMCSFSLLGFFEDATAFRRLLTGARLSVRFKLNYKHLSNETKHSAARINYASDRKTGKAECSHRCVK